MSITSRNNHDPQRAVNPTHIAARAVPTIHGPLTFTYATTDNCFSGQPWPPAAPPHELWVEVSGSTAFTTWRQISLSSAALAQPLST